MIVNKKNLSRLEVKINGLSSFRLNKKSAGNLHKSVDGPFWLKAKELVQYGLTIYKFSLSVLLRIQGQIASKSSSSSQLFFSRWLVLHG